MICKMKWAVWFYALCTTLLPCKDRDVTMDAGAEKYGVELNSTDVVSKDNKSVDSNVGVKVDVDFDV